MGHTLKQNCEEHLRDILFLTPWLALAHPRAIRGIKPERHASSSTVRPQADELARISPSAPLEKRTSLNKTSAGTKLEARLTQLEQIPTLRELSELDQSLCPLIEEALKSLLAGPAPVSKEERGWLAELSDCIREASTQARHRIFQVEQLVKQSEDMAAMDFTFLFDPARDLFSIRFNVTEGRRDASFYDLLASEARLCSYVTIAQGQVPQDHWFAMGRLLVAARGEPILVSWSGSMFEYLMPMLVMPTYDNTLLSHTCRGAVQHQIEYGQTRSVPWGISESGYNRTDIHFNYQYRAFGVPGLGLKRGLADDLVIAPYATAMALMIAPREACENLQRMATEGREGPYGFYEAVDYTPLASATRGIQRHHSLVYGPPSRDEPAGAGLFVERCPHATTIHGLPPAQSGGPDLAGTGSPSCC